MLDEGWKAWNLDSGSCTIITASSASKSRKTIVLSENCSFRSLRFSLMWRRGILSSPAHRRFASSAETELHAGASAKSIGGIVHPGRASENRSGRLLIAYSTYRNIRTYIHNCDRMFFLDFLIEQYDGKPQKINVQNNIMSLLGHTSIMCQ